MLQPKIPKNNYKSVPIAQIYGDPNFNSRGYIPKGEVLDLVASIRDHGLQQAIVVQPYGEEHPVYKYRAVMGHRRLKAVELLYEETKDEKWAYIDANVLEEIIEANRALTLNLIENIDRRSLTIVQEANALQRYIDNGLNVSEIAQYLHQTRYWVQTRLNILKFPPEVQREVMLGNLTTTHIADLSKLPDTKAIYEETRRILDAKTRGVEIDVRKLKPSKPHEKFKRTVHEAFRLKDEIMSIFGPCFAAEIIAWYCGVLSDVDIHETIKREADLAGIPYTIPKELQRG